MTTRRPPNGKVSATVRRLLALEDGQRQLTAEVGGVNTRLDGLNGRMEILTEHVVAQGRTLERVVSVLTEQGHILTEQGQVLGRIETLLERVLTFGPKIEALEHRVTALEGRA